MTEKILEQALSNGRDQHRVTREAENVVRTANERARVIIQKANETVHRQGQNKASK